MKKPYEKPVINKLVSGRMNKFGYNPAYARKVCERIAGVTVEELVSKHGSPLYVYDEQNIRRKYRTMYGAFSSRYPNVTFGWSYKTNYLGAICSIMHQEGAIAEVVSQMEYEKARARGIPGEQIMFNGPNKGHILERAVTESAMINVDNLDELHDLETLADKLDRTIKVGIRLNLDAGIYPLWSRFGFNLESGQAMEAVKRMARGGRIELQGVHCHIGTYITDPEAYGKQIEKMVAFGYECEDAFGFSMTYLDIGGGFPSRSQLRGTYLPAEIAIPPIDEYAEAVSEALGKHLRPGDFPQLYLESGRALIDEAGYLITSVCATKRLPDGTRSYVVDAGVNLLYTATWYKFDIKTDREVSGINERSIIYGPLCMNIDVVDEGVMLPPLTRGTRLILHPVGAYNNTQWMQFIEYRPACVLVGEDGQVDVIREGEDLSDIELRERIPERLTQ